MEKLDADEILKRDDLLGNSALSDAKLFRRATG